MAGRYLRSPATASSVRNSRSSANSSKSTAGSNVETMISTMKATEVSIGGKASGIIAETTTPPMHSGNKAIIAYVHHLSQIKRNKNNTIDYFTLFLKTKDEPAQKVLLYSKHKRPSLVDSEKCRTPVKIQCFTLHMVRR